MVIFPTFGSNKSFASNPSGISIFIVEAPVEIKFDFTTSRFKGFLIFDDFIRRMLHDTLAIFYRMHILRYYHDNNKRKWVYDRELEMQLNTGESEK